MSHPRARSRPLVVGTRGSPLARRQAMLVMEALQAAHPKIEVRIEIIRTHGDEVSEIPTPSPLHQRWKGGAGERWGGSPDRDEPTLGEGLFVRSLELALLDGRIDLAVHSFKDLPSAPTIGLCLAAFPPRADPRDVLVAREGRRFDALSPGSSVGTGSPRRSALLQSLRPDLRVEPLRGNVDTRVRSVAEGHRDAIILAAAGLLRLGLEGAVSEWFDPEVFVPAIGQGVLALQARSDDAATIGLASHLDDPAARTCSLAERAVATRIAAGCQTALAAHARLLDGKLTLHAFTLALDGRSPVRARASGPPEAAEQLGAQVGDSLSAQAASRP